MNKMTHVINLASMALAATLLLPASARAQEWTGNGTTLNWSDTGNWDSGTTPTSSSLLYFSDLFYPNAYTNAVGLVNNIVDTSFSAGGIYFNSLSGGNFSSATNHHYTTLISAGITLTLGTGSGNPSLVAGDVPGSGQWMSSNFTNYSTITGPGSLVVSDSASSMSVGWRNRATLDLAGLNTFTTSVKQILVGASSDNPGNPGPTGWLLLAKTNSITTAANLSAPGIILGSANSGNASGVTLLGGTNTINTDGFTVGARRGNSTMLAFGSAYSNTPTAGNLILRGSAGGSSRVGTFSIGDMAAQPADYLGSPLGIGSAGIADFGGGSVDIRADKIYVGRSAADTGTGGGFANGFGTLILERGTVDANNLYIAYKQGTNASSSLGSGTATPSCIITLRSNFQMTVNQDVTMAFRNNSTFGSQTPYGTLVLNDSATLNIGGNVTTPTNGISVLQFGGGMITMTGGGNLTNSTLTGFGTIAGANNITVVSNLTVGGAFNSGTLNLTGNLNLATPFPLVFDLGANATVGGGVNDHINLTGNLSVSNNSIGFTFGAPLLGGSTYHLIDYTGTKSGNLFFTNTTRSAIGIDQSTAGHVDLIVTNWTPATLTWVGNTSGAIVGAAASNLWTTADTNWSNGGSPDRFYQMDNVVFDDTAIFTNIYPHGVLSPASITVNGSKSFSITNRSTAGGFAGGIVGNCPITMNGTGILLLGSYSNITTGPIVVNNGILRPFDPSFSFGDIRILGATNTPMFVTNTGTFDYNGIGSISAGKQIVIKGSGFGGRGAITNGVSNSGATVNGYFLTLAGDATVSADIGGWGLRGLSSAGPFYSGSLKLNGYTLTKLGAARVSLQDVVANDAGSINFGGGHLQVQNSVIGGAGSLNFSNNTYVQFAFAAGATSYVSKAISTYGNFGILTPASGSPAVSQVLIDSSIGLGGALSVTNIQTLILGGVVSGAQSLTKYGNSNLVLNAANTYGGQTIINGGTLSLGASGSFANSPLIAVNPGAALDVTAKGGTFTLASAQTLNLNGTVVGNLTVGPNSTMLGNGIVNGSLTLNPGGEIAPATTNVTGTMIVSNNLTLAGGHLTWEFSPSFDLSDAIIVGGNLTLTGTNVFTVSSIGGFDPSGTNTLITYTGTLNGGLTNLALNTPARFVVEFVDPATTPGAIKVRLVTPSPTLTWKGGHPSNPINWDIQTTTNWDNGALPDIFYPSDLVRFDDTANTNVVRLVGTIGPAAVSMENSAISYFVGGGGALITSSLTNNSGSLTVSNTANNFLTGVGMVLNGGSVTMAQPVNATLQANLNGGGTLNKAATSTLTLVGNSANFSGPVNVNAGTLRAGSTNVLGSGTTTVAGNATLDVNGQLLSAANLSVIGTGADGWGAINNRGLGRTNNLGNVTLAGDTTFGALTNAWGISGTLVGGGYTLSKTNVNDVWIQTGSDTDLGVIDVQQGRLVFGQAGTTLGRDANTATIRSGGTLALTVTNAMPQSGIAPDGIDAGLKPLDLKSGATLESIGFGVNNTRTNTHSGPIAIVTNANFKVGVNSVLALKGPISGNGHLTLTNGGTLLLTGTNTYASNTYVYSGTLLLPNSNSLPVTTILSVSNLISTFGNASVSFLNDVIFPNTSVMQLSGRNGQVGVGGNGTWNGPVFLHGTNSPTITISGGNNLLNLAGPLITTNLGGQVRFGGANTRLAGAIIAPAASVTIGVGDGLGAALGERFTTVTFGQSNLWSGSMQFDRGRVNLGANNSLPPGVPITVGTLSSGVGDRRVFFNLGGFNQTLSSVTETAVGDSQVLIFNGSTNSNSTLTYAGTGTNTWAIRLIDNIQQNLRGNSAKGYTNSGDFTLGYSFTPNKNMTVTHFRHYFGTKVSLWTDDGTLLATANVTSTPENWTVTPLSTPVLLTAGTTYRLTAYTGGGEWYESTFFPAFFADGTFSDSYAGAGDAFPATADTVDYGYLVDLIYSEGSRPLALTVTSGTLNLLSTNTYTGPTLISGGTLNVNPGSGFTAGYVGQLNTTPVSVTGTGTLGGNGLVNAAVNVTAGGSIAPGVGIGRLTINSNVIFGAGSKYVCEVNLVTGTNDLVAGINTLTYGGTLVITNIGSQPFTNGTVLKLFSAANYVAGAVAMQPAAPGINLAWDKSYLAVDGTLRVIPAPPAISGVTKLPDGNVSFMLTGTTGQPYSVLASTNVALPIASWQVLTSGTAPAASWLFTDLTATNHPGRFYTTSTP